jgi:hypothetical protein
MNCIAPPELEDAQLLMYLDGDAKPAVGAHIEQCAFCREKAGHLERVELELKRLSFRGSCPSAHELRDYYFSLLSRPRLEEITEHLVICPHCTHELLVDYADLPRPIPEKSIGLLEQIRLLVAQLIPSGQSLQPAYAWRGGAEKKSRVIYRANDIQVSISLRSQFENSDSAQLDGLVTGIPLNDLRVSLWEGDTLLSIEEVDKAGNFEFMDLSPREYDLVLNSPDVKVRIPSVSLLTP